MTPEATLKILRDSPIVAWQSQQNLKRRMNAASGPTSLSQQYRARAEECRTKAQTFRAQRRVRELLDVAAKYERKAEHADALEIKQSKNKSAFIA
jgi:hypothetical protein